MKENDEQEGQDSGCRDATCYAVSKDMLDRICLTLLHSINDMTNTHRVNYINKNGKDYYYDGSPNKGIPDDICESRKGKYIIHNKGLAETMNTINEVRLILSECKKLQKEQDLE